MVMMRRAEKPLQPTGFLSNKIRKVFYENIPIANLAFIVVPSGSNGSV